jgi:hypothetical protein
MAGGGSVTILSDIADDIRAGGGTITIAGAVGGDVILGGGQINLSGSGVKGDAIIGAGVVRVWLPVVQVAMLWDLNEGKRLYSLDEDATVVTGHGPDTRLGDEMRQNPFVRA